MRMPAEIESPVVLNVIGPGTVPETYMQWRQGMGNGKCYCACASIKKLRKREIKGKTFKLARSVSSSIAC